MISLAILNVNVFCVSLILHVVSVRETDLIFVVRQIEGKSRYIALRSFDLVFYLVPSSIELTTVATKIAKHLGTYLRRYIHHIYTCRLACMCIDVCAHLGMYP